MRCCLWLVILSLVGLVGASMWMMQLVRERQQERRQQPAPRAAESPTPQEELGPWPPLEQARPVGDYDHALKAAMGDWNRDGRTDVVVTDGTFAPRAFLQQPDGTFETKDLERSATLLPGDFDGKGEQELLMMADNSLELQFYPGPKPQAEGGGALKLKGLGAAAGHLDDDAVLDLALPASGDRCILLLRHPGGKSERKVIGCPNVRSAQIVEGHLILRTGEQLLAYSAPWTGKPVVLELDAEIKAAAFGDVDADGHQDVVFTEAQGFLFVGFGSETGKFATIRLGSSSGYPVLADLDEDGDLDLVNCDANWIRCWRNEGNRHVRHSFTRKIQGSHVLLVQDFDGDHRPDFLTGATDRKGAVQLHLQK